MASSPPQKFKFIFHLEEDIKCRVLPILQNALRDMLGCATVNDEILSQWWAQCQVDNAELLPLITNTARLTELQRMQELFTHFTYAEPQAFVQYLDVLCNLKRYPLKAAKCRVIIDKAIPGSVVRIQCQDNGQGPVRHGVAGGTLAPQSPEHQRSPTICNYVDRNQDLSHSSVNNQETSNSLTPSASKVNKIPGKAARFIPFSSKRSSKAPKYKGEKEPFVAVNVDQENMPNSNLLTTDSGSRELREVKHGQVKKQKKSSGKKMGLFKKTTACVFAGLLAGGGGFGINRYMNRSSNDTSLARPMGSSNAYNITTPFSRPTTSPFGSMEFVGHMLEDGKVRYGFVDRNMTSEDEMEY